MTFPSRSLLVCALLLVAVRVEAQDGVSPRPPEEQRELRVVRLAVPMAGLDPKGMESWKGFAKISASELGPQFQFVGCGTSADAAKLLERGKVDMAVLEPEDYVRIAAVTERGATLAVLEADGSYGFQVALLVRPDAVYGSEAEVMSSDAVIGILPLVGFLGRYYRGPLTDERWRLRAEFRRRIEYEKTGEELIKRLHSGIGGRRIDAVLLPLKLLQEPNEEGLRNGLRELWLSPFCPGRVVAGRAGLGKRQRLQLGESMIKAGQGGVLGPARVGGLRRIDDAAFEPLKEFVPGRRD